MSNLTTPFDQWIIAFFSAVILYISFKALNNCTKSTKIIIRIPLILFMTASAGTLVLLASGTEVQWPCGLMIIAAAFHLALDRRMNIHNPFRKSHSTKF